MEKAKHHHRAGARRAKNDDDDDEEKNPYTRFRLISPHILLSLSHRRIHFWISAALNWGCFFGIVEVSVGGVRDETAFVCDVVWNRYYGNRKWVVYFRRRKPGGGRMVEASKASHWLFNHMIYEHHRVYSLF